MSTFPEGKKAPGYFQSQLTDLIDYSALVIQFVSEFLKKRKMFYRTLRVSVGFKHVGSLYPVKKIRPIQETFCYCFLKAAETKKKSKAGNTLNPNGNKSRMPSARRGRSRVGAEMFACKPVTLHRACIFSIHAVGKVQPCGKR